MTHVRRTFAAIAAISMSLLPGAPGAVADDLDPVRARGGPRGDVVAENPSVGRGTYHGLSRPARDLPKAHGRGGFDASPARPFRSLLDVSGADAAEPQRSGARAPEPKAIATPIESFDGIANADQGGGILPPDTNGDVGPDHYVQMVNVSFAVFDKTTGTPLVGPSFISDLWPSVPGPCDDEDQGDPIVVYDEIADRWLLSQFAFTRPVQPPAPPFYQCIAISETSDAAGAYHLYSFNLSDDEGTDSLLHDYPKIGVWPDGYYMTANQFDMSQEGAFAGAAIYVFEREPMLAGDPAEVLYFDMGSDISLGGMLPSDLDGEVLPPVGSPNWVLQLDADEFFGLPDGLRVLGVVADWATPDDSFVGLAGIVDFKSEGLKFDPVLCTETIPPGIVVLADACIKQKSAGGQKLDPISDRLMWRLGYRNFGTHESLVANHTVDVDNAPTAGVQWFEIRDPANPVLHQGGVIGKSGSGVPPDGHSRWMGSVAMDGDGNIAAGYSVSSSTLFPSVRVAGRQVTANLGKMPEGEAVVVAGGGSQTGGHRWGDYTSMSVDPDDDCTFWHTNQYYPATSDDAWETTIASFEIPGCDGLPTGTMSGSVEDGLASPVEGATVFAGTLSTRTAADGSFSFDPIPAGTYDVTAVAPGFAPVTLADELVTDGWTNLLGALELGAYTNDRADFDGDGFSDVAFGAPKDVRNGAAGGVVNVLYGSATGLTSTGDQILHQDLGALGSEKVEAGDRFGSALAVGDFDDDGYSDLAIGAYGEDLGGVKNAGIVHVFYGSDDGLDTSSPDTFHQNKSGIKDVNERNDQFGRALAAGDFDGDGDDDLAIGVPGENGSRGAVLVLEGKPGGVSKDDSLWSQDSPGIADRAESGDRFGASLATGDLDGDTRDDLAVGVPREDLSGQKDGGVVNVIFGAPGGLSAAGDLRLSQDSSGIANVVEANDRFGWTLAIGNFDGDGHDDLAIGVPFETTQGVGSSGGVNVLYGSPAGPSAVGDRFFHRASSGITGGLGDGDRFSESLAVADVNGDGADDLVVGAPRDTYLGRSGAGTFNVIMGVVGGALGPDDGRLWNQQMAGGSFSEAGDRFAEALSGADTNGDGLDELIVGVPREDTGFIDWGIAHELRGSPAGITSLNGAFWHQDVLGIASNPRDRELFASAIAG